MEGGGEEEEGGLEHVRFWFGYLLTSLVSGFPDFSINKSICKSCPKAFHPLSTKVSKRFR